MQTPRVAAVAYLNALPLIYGLLRGRQRRFCDLTLAPPGDCARLLKDGLADVALIPSVEFARIAGLAAVPGMGISSRHEVRSVLLVTRVEPAAIRTLAVDRDSRTSVALARIVLARRHGCRPRIEAMPASLPLMLERHDAALIIGDGALRASPPDAGILPGGRVLDLASEWNEMTRLPFVFAFWACRPVIPVGDVVSVLGASLEEGLASLETIVAEEARRSGLSAHLLRAYLTENIHYTLGRDEASSLRVFYRMCGEEGLLAGDVRASLETVDSVTAGDEVPPLPDPRSRPGAAGDRAPTRAAPRS